MAVLDLTSYTAIQTNLFVKIEIPQYRTTSSGGYTTQTLYISDRTSAYTVEGNSYTGLGRLLDITTSASEITPSESEVTVNLSGIPTNSIAEIVNSKIKGSKVTIYRGVFNANTGAELAIQGRYRGFVNNYSLTEEYDPDARTATNNILLICTNAVSILGNKITGRKTNPESEKKFFPTDLSMDRVPTLAEEYYNFGKRD